MADFVHDAITEISEEIDMWNHSLSKAQDDLKKAQVMDDAQQLTSEEIQEVIADYDLMTRVPQSELHNLMIYRIQRATQRTEKTVYVLNPYTYDEAFVKFSEWEAPSHAIKLAKIPFDAEQDNRYLYATKLKMALDNALANKVTASRASGMDRSAGDLASAGQSVTIPRENLGEYTLKVLRADASSKVETFLRNEMENRSEIYHIHTSGLNGSAAVIELATNAEGMGTPLNLHIYSDGTHMLNSLAFNSGDVIETSKYIQLQSLANGIALKWQAHVEADKLHEEVS